MILGFKETIKGKKSNFVAKILLHYKIHTIREDHRGRWVEGRQIEMATGVRTKQYRQFNKNHPELQKCKGTQRIMIEFNPNGRPFIFVDNRKLQKEMHHVLASNDGFTNLMDFYDWFLDIRSGKPRHKYVGKIIHWTDYKY